MAKIEKHLDEQETAARQQGYRKVPRKTKLEHFDWLALYQVDGMSYSEIARKAARPVPNKSSIAKLSKLA